MPVSRRQLLVGGGLSLFSPLLASRLLRAQAQPGGAGRTDRRYVFAYFSGGWDTLLSLDPRDPAVFTNGNIQTTQIQTGYELLPVSEQSPVSTGLGTFGPYIGRLVDHADRLAVVRGISMETLTHEVGRRRFLTGRPPSGLSARGSSVATWLASHLGERDLVPQIAIGVESYNVDQPTYATALRVASGGDLVRALRPQGAAFDDVTKAHIHAALASAARCDKARSSPLWRQAEGAREKAAGMVEGRLDGLFDLFANTPEMAALRERHAVRSQDGPSSPEAQCAIAAQAITGDVARVVSIAPATGLDTHFQNWATDQGPRQRRGFNAIAQLAQHLAETPYDTESSYLDHTLIVGFSEFSRTPVLNPQSGRDHHLTNACFVLGGGVRPGVYGSSSNVGLLPEPVRLDDGVRDDAGEILLPEHVLQGLFDEVGLGEEPDLRVPALQLLQP